MARLGDPNASPRRCERCLRPYPECGVLTLGIYPRWLCPGCAAVVYGWRDMREVLR
jgi:hypothetical protein